MSDALLVGPLLRYVDEIRAVIWVEVGEAGAVRVRAGERAWQARTFTVHGHHYAVIDVSGLEPGTVTEYTVDIGGRVVWPPSGTDLPPSRIATLRPGQELRLAFGSCRMSVPHDAQANQTYGVDALRVYARQQAGNSPGPWPDLVLFLGDQVYADETSDEMREFIAGRRSLDEPPGTELKDFEEYTHLYRLAWTDPLNRWLLSTLPSAMIFDDHDIRDDWNTSAQWRREMARKPWWRDRIVGGLASYWIYQHLGNLSPDERAGDELWARIAAAQRYDDDTTPESQDWGGVLDAFAQRVDEHPDSYQWSYFRDIGRARLVVVDSRAARVLTPSRRSIVDDKEMDWLDGRLVGGFDHVIVGTSLPFLMSRGLHDFEAWSEAVSSGAWGERAARAGEKIRRAVDLEHWAAFHEGFRRVGEMLVELACGRRGDAPGSVTLLSGDVHHSYVAEAAVAGPGRVIQAVCSPIRNPLPRKNALVMSAMGRPPLATLTHLAARMAKVQPPPFEWSITHGPWYDNNLATLQTDGRRLSMVWEAGSVDEADERPRLQVVSEFGWDGPG
jgi:hypothetical protein